MKAVLMRVLRVLAINLAYTLALPWLNIMSGCAAPIRPAISSSIGSLTSPLKGSGRITVMPSSAAAILTFSRWARPTSESAWKKPMLFRPVRWPHCISARNSSLCSARTGNTIGECGRRRFGEPAIGPKNGARNSSATVATAVDGPPSCDANKMNAPSASSLRALASATAPLLSSSSVRSTILRP